MRSRCPEPRAPHTALGSAGCQVGFDKDVPALLAFPPGTDLHAHPLYVDARLILQEKASCFPATCLLPLPPSLWAPRAAGELEPTAAEFTWPSWCGPPQHGLSSNKMALITSYRDAMRTHEQKMALITPECAPFRLTRALAAGRDGQPAELHVIDACAAPGNKTLQAAALLNSALPHLAALSPGPPPTLAVTAFDRSTRRLALLKKRVEAAGGADIIRAVEADWLAVDPADPTYRTASAVLVDPSCSVRATQHQTTSSICPCHFTT